MRTRPNPFTQFARKFGTGFSVLLAAAALVMSCAADKPLPRAVPLLARPLPLSAVRLTGGPLKHAQELDAEYLLKLEPDRMLAYYRIRAGLEPKAKGYGGWDGGGRNLTGHIAGHYLSAVSLMYAATGDSRFKERADYLVSELKLVQDKQGDGYLGALENGEERFAEVARGEIRSGGFDLNGLWSPWHVLHKMFAGLRDAYRYTGSRAALVMETKFAAWAEGVLAHLSEDQVQKMLNTEFGGMSEVLADLYADTGDARWLALSRKFEHRVVLEPLQRGEDRLAGLHANTQVPKLLGSLARYIDTGDANDGAAARFFWEEVAHHRSYATGGHGKDEYFGRPDHLSDRVDGRTAETCNVYNMLKMTRKLFALRPDPAYPEFQERALFNHILASMDPQDGRTSYMVPVGRGVTQEYQAMFDSFTCCVGSGMESHALHEDGLYYENGDRLWVNLYVPSMAVWQAAGVDSKMDTSFPEGEDATLKLKVQRPRRFTLALRRPSWAGDGFRVTVNGVAASRLPAPGHYVELARKWKTGDTVSLTLPKRVHLEPTPDKPRVAALMSGPLVLAGDLGASRGGGQRGAVTPPVLVTADHPVTEWLHPRADRPGSFEATARAVDGSSGSSERTVPFTSFYRTHRRLYEVYWDLFTPAEWEKKAAEVAAEQMRRRKLEAATVAYAQPGEMQPERDFNFQQASEVGPLRLSGRTGRQHPRWFSFDVPVDPAHLMALVVTYNTQERPRRTFDILVKGEKIAQQIVEAWTGPGNPSRFFDVEYGLPESIARSAGRVTVRFEAARGREPAAVFGVRTIRADAER